jgi:tripartite-type tricarboxylate transporter receptor subunit TctC
MKKLLTTILLAGASLMAQAQEKITILYAFSPSDTTGNYSRILSAEANKLQNKYTFVYDAKPGAGGTIATNEALNKPNTILHHSTAFFVRPNIFPKESWDLGLFREQFVYCVAPMVVAGSTVTNWKEVAEKKSVTIGISGLGVTTHLMAVQLQKKYPNLVIIPFKSTTDAMLSMFSKQTDLAIGFPGEVRQWVDTKKVSVLGITGPKSEPDFPSLVSQGQDAVFSQMRVGQHFVVPKTWPESKSEEIYEILMKAYKSPVLQEAFKEDLCAAQPTAYKDLDKFYNFHSEYWRKLSAGIKVE